METSKTGSRHEKFFVGAIVALLLTNAVTVYCLVNNENERVIITAEKQEVEQNYIALEEDFHEVTAALDAASIEIGQLRGQNADLDRIIAEKQEVIEREKKNLANAYSQNSLTLTSLNKARALISEYETAIAALQQQVKDYEVQTAQLTTDLHCEREVNTQLTEVKEGLENKIAEAAILQLPKVEVVAVKRKSNGTEVPVDKLKAAENLKITFETGANKALDPGKLDLYVRIINPKGETIAVNERGSGVIPGTDAQKPVLYTKQASINWNQQNKKVVVYWNRYITEPGTYKVEVYQGGQIIGKGATRLS